MSSSVRTQRILGVRLVMHLIRCWRMGQHTHGAGRARTRGRICAIIARSDHQRRM